MNRLILFFVLLSFISFSAKAQKEIPELSGQRVHDEAKVLSQANVNDLEQALKIFEDSTTNQIAILIIPSLDGEVIETYALRAAEKWKLGTKNNDNGAILVVSIEDRKMRIEVGQGLEGPLPDAICNRIIRNEMTPNFRRGDYDAGVNAAIVAMVQAIKGEYKAEDKPRRRGNKGSPWLTILIIIVFLIFRFASRNKKGGGGSGWSAGTGWFIGSALGSGSGRSWGGGGGGGGFSGGGGSFGGGGSSGSW